MEIDVFEPLEPRRLLAAPYVLETSVVNPASGVQYALHDGMMIWPELGSRLNIVAEVQYRRGRSAEGVRFDYDNGAIRREEWQTPLAFAGDKGGVLNAFDFAEGPHTLTITPLAGDGSEGRPLTFGFTVVKGEPQGPQGWPDETNTGPDNGVKVVIPGVYEIRSPGVYENFIAAGGISVLASNVTLRNFVSQDNVKLYGDGPLLLEDGEIYSTTASDGLSGSNLTLRRMHIHDVHDGIRIGSAGNVLIEDTYIADIGAGGGGHSDGIQTLADVPNVTIRHSRIVAGNSTSCINGVGPGWAIENNLLQGGQYALWFYNYGSPVVRGNVFDGWVNGVARFWPQTGVWENNVDGEGNPIE